MLFPSPRTVGMHLANVFGVLLVGLFFAYIGLNAASGCGQGGGSCIVMKDLMSSGGQSQQLAVGLPQRTTQKNKS